ncbi:DUF4347 domain-containing protein [Pseudomonas sp. LA21]|uniref:DUF4347 domain-containing protein n=1 Tax=Pseudomonas sp. LA21 TaxID=2893373 RepID=UPI001FB5789C|nr:DUF4347 domain-containing protein [Pseudomonas sp. LA21]MCJ1886616.1 DUF4347 domain-containing protein [Pseudomonas sp. LA21]
MWWKKTAREQVVGQPVRSALALALEARMMFDGAVAATAVGAADAAAGSDAPGAKDNPTDAAQHDSVTDKPAAAPAGSADHRQEVVFVDSNVRDYQQLVSGLKPGTEVVVLDANKDGLKQMADYLDGRSGVDAIHVLSHGDVGKVQLGNNWLASADLAARSELLNAIGQSLDKDGDILLYGCQVGAGGEGLAFIDNLAAATQADVSASSDATGATAKGGNWALEVQQGVIETATLSVGSYSDLLAAFSDDMTNSGGNAASFVRTISGTSFTYTFTSLGDGGDLAYETQYGSANSPSMSLLSFAGDFNTTERMTITRTDLADFTFTSIYLDNPVGNQGVTVAGYLDGVLVGAAQNFGTGFGTLNFGGIRVDEVRITSTDFFGLAIDNFTGDTNPPSVSPSLTATPAAPTFTENGSAVDLFSGVVANTNDAGQTFSGMTLTVTNVSSDASDVLNIGGIDIGLVNTASTSVGGLGTYSVSLVGGTATITLSGLNRDNTQMAQLIDAMTYRNSGDNPGNLSRVVSIASIVDSGASNSNANPGISSTVTVIPVNDAPALTPVNTNVGYTENGAGVILNSGLSIADPDSSASFQGATVAISDVRAGDVLSVGSMPGGFISSYNTATGVLTLSGNGSMADLQTALRSITYSSTSDDPTFGGTDGTRQINFTVTDGSGATSSAVTAQVALTAVNDAPTLSGGPYTWAGTNEDTTSSAASVSTLLASTTHADVDGPASGIAITGSIGNGGWEYSTDGLSWNSIGSVSNSSALLLSAATQLRYVPNSLNGETPTLTYRAWDQSAGSASTNSVRNLADTTTNGGSSAFSTGTAQATLTVSSVNDAPVLASASPTLTGLTDSDTNTPGMAVSGFATGDITDVDTGAVKGIAITGLGTGIGTWQYSTNGGASWQDIGPVADNAALLLRSTDRVRFVPDGVHGTIATLTYHAWDQTGATAGQQGTKMDASVTGGSSAFSIGSNTGSLTVTAIDDAPMVTASGGSSAFVEGNNVTSTPVVIDSGITVTDSDSPQLSSATVAITGNFLSSQDVLAFTNNPATMGDIGASYDGSTGVMTLYSAGGATAAQWQAALRAVTYSNSSDTPSSLDRTITFKVNDGNSDSAGANRTVTVAPTNDAPTVSMPASLTAAEDTATAITGISFADVDAGSASLTVTLSVGSGTLSAVAGGGVSVGGSASALTLSGSIADINAFIAGGAVHFLGTANSTSSVTLTASIDDGGHSGGAAQTGSGTVTIAITPVNDAPHVSAPVSIGVAEDVPQALTGISFSDIDASSGTVSVQFSVAPGHGTLAATSGAGVTVLGSGSGTLSLSGMLSDINAFVTGGGVSFTTAANATGNVVLDVSIDDSGQTGSGGNLTDHTTVTLTVSAVNDAPVNTVPGTQGVLQDGTLVFSSGNGNPISIDDADAGGSTVSVTLTASNGQITLGSLNGLVFSVGNGTGDGTMTFQGSLADINIALAGLTFTPTPGYYGPASLQITTNDLGNAGSGGSQTDTDTILITVAQPNPSITGVAGASPDGTYKVGDTVHITVTFDQAVTVSGGVPTLLLETGAIDRSAIYVSGSGSSTLTFAYVVQAGDYSADLDYIGTNALSLNGATIDSVSLGNPAFNTLPLSGAADSLSANAALVIDGVAPVVSSVAVPANGTYVAGQNLDFTVNFSENVTVDTSGGTPRLAVTLDGGGTLFAQYLSGSGSNALVFRLVVASGHLDSNGISVGSSIQANGGILRDAVGNDANTTLNNVASTAGVLVDAVAPSVSSVSVPGGVPYNAGDILTFVVNTSEAVVVNGVPRMALDVGGTTVYADFVAGSGTSSLIFQYTIQPGDNDADGIQVSGLQANGATLRDATGNDMNLVLNNVGSTAGVIVDTVAPTSSAIVTLDPSPSIAGSVRYTLTFSEGVSGVDLSDFTLVGTGTATGSLSGLQQIDARTYQITVSGVSGTGTLGLNLNGSGTGIVDGVGNPLNGGLVGALYVVDRDAPTVTSISVPPGAIHSTGDTLEFVVNTSEAVVVNGVPRMALDIGGVAVYADFVSGSGTNSLVFRYTVQPGDNDADGIQVSGLQANGATLRDATGNDMNLVLNNVGSSAGVIVDTLAPTPSAIVTLDPSPSNSGSVRYTLTFSEGVSGVDLGDFTLVGTGTAVGSLSGLQQIDARTYQITVSGVSGTGTLGLNLNGSGTGIVDGAGNPLNGGLAGTVYVIDRDAPTPGAIVTLDPSPSNAGSVRYVVTFNEGVSGVDLSDFALVGTGTAAGSLSGLQQIDARTYQITVSGVSGTGTLGLNLKGSGTGIVDGADNPLNGGLTGAVYVIDRDAPTVTAVSVPPGALYNAGDTLEFTVQASEAVMVDGSPKLAIDMGGRTVYADYISGSGSTGLVFRYTVQAGDNDGDGIRVAGLSANGGSLRDATGNALNPSLNGIGDSRGVLVDTRAPTTTGVVRLDPSPTGENTVNFLVTFDENVSGVDVGDFSLVTSNSASGSILSVIQLDARIYRVTVGSVSGQGRLGLTVNAGGISDAAGNALANSLRGDGYVIGSLSDGDPQFRVEVPVGPPLPSPTPLQPNVPVLVAPPSISPVLPPSLFEPPSLGGLPPLGNIFTRNGAPTQSFLSQVFGDASYGDGSARGFLGFGGGDAGVFGSSTLSGLFNRDGFDDSTPLKVFERRSGDINQGLHGVFGAPTLAQQLQQIHESEQQPVRDLAWALGQIAQDREAS